MADGSPYYGDYAVKLPNMFPSPGQALQGAISFKEREQLRQQELEYRKQKDAENDEWRKLALIQDLTDLSKYQTGSDMANAIGNQQAASVLQKYTAQAKTLSGTELLAKINQEMSGVINSMGALKTELDLADKQVAALKLQYPGLIDVSGVAKAYRADVLGRRLKNDKEFLNPVEVQPSSFNLTDPEFLSKYVTSNKALDEEIVNPKGLEPAEVLSGSPNKYTKYKGKVPFWMKENFDRGKFNKGFYQGKEEPSLSIKGHQIPPESLPASQGKPFMVVDDDVYKRFQENDASNITLIAAARNKYKDYDNFSNEEKELAKKNVLYEKIKTLDKSGYYPSETKTPSASLLKFYAGGGSGGGTDKKMNDVYKEISEKADDPARPRHRVPMNELSATAQMIILKQARDISGDKDITNASIYVQRDPEGTLSIRDLSNNLISVIDLTDINIPANSSVLEKRQAVEEEETQPKPTPPKTVKKKITW